VTDAIIQPMPELDPEQLNSLRAAIAANGVLVPVVKDQHGRIIDGNHRAAIAAELGIDYPAVTVTVADDVDAWDQAVSLNCARRHLNREQTRELIRAEIHRKPDESDRAIARRIGCSPTTVGSVRTEIRQWAEETTADLKRRVNEIRDEAFVYALAAHHRGGLPWQFLADKVERELYPEVKTKCDNDSDLGEDFFTAIWAALYGSFFDALRAVDCPEWCKVCTDSDRQWRREHPGQVYRWSEPPEVSNLDSAEAVVVR